MNSEVDICNLALSYLGDTANISSLDERSVQAELCRHFYPMARDMLLEMHSWNFAVTRTGLSLLHEKRGDWLFTYALPNKMLRALSILREDSQGERDTSSDIPFLIEAMPTGEVVICTNQKDAVLRYVLAVDDPIRFTPLFTIALSWLLASKLAGPIYKGTEGVRMSQTALAAFSQAFSAAVKSDANQGLMPITYIPEGIRVRNG